MPRLRWTFHAGTSVREDGLQVVARLRSLSMQPDPQLTAESLSQGMDEVAWEVNFPDGRRVTIPWREALATPIDLMAFCDERWHGGTE